MGNLKPDTTYIYESPDGGKTIYAREAGIRPIKRVLIGHEYPGLAARTERTRLWQEILTAAETNETLRSELERVEMVYHLIKDQDKPDHHSV